MKKLKATIFFAIIVGLNSCGNGKTGAQEANEVFEREMQQMEQDQMTHERYIDSLVNVASGLEGITMKANRQHALDILKKKYPSMNDRWDAIQTSINKMEIYSE